MIELRRVTKLYGNVIGVNDLTIDLASGAYGLIGPNGSGKTTLINLLIGHLRPTLGRLRVFGSDPVEDRGLLRRIGLCPASDVLYPNVSALEWVQYQIRLHGFASSEARNLAESSLELVGMTDAMRRPMGTFSLGMRQRTKIAQAIAHQPDLLILDEPYNGLDPVGRHEMTEVLRSWGRRGRGLLFASHVLQEIESVTSSFLLIHSGRLLASGTADEIESILLSAPQEICVYGDDVARLVPMLADAGWVSALHLNQLRRELRVSVTRPKEFYRQIASWVVEFELRIERLQTPAGDLEAVFDALLKRHRGEVA